MVRGLAHALIALAIRRTVGLPLAVVLVPQRLFSPRG